MKTTKSKQKNINLIIKRFITIFLFSIAITSCSKDDNANDGLAFSYSGNGNFNFTGDFNMSYSGSADNVQIAQTNGQESIPISFFDSQGKEFFIGLRGMPLETRAYTMKTLGDEGYSAIVLEGNIYDSGAIGGKGTVTISTLNKNKIKGSVDMRLARPLNTADTVIVKGTFELNGK
jgi:hypothetical protein